MFLESSTKTTLSGGSSACSQTKLRHHSSHVGRPLPSEKNFYPSPTLFFFLTPLYFSPTTTFHPILSFTMGFTDFVSDAGLTRMRPSRCIPWLMD